MINDRFIRKQYNHLRTSKQNSSLLTKISLRANMNNNINQFRFNYISPFTQVLLFIVYCYLIFDGVLSYRLRSSGSVAVYSCFEFTLSFVNHYHTVFVTRRLVVAGVLLYTSWTCLFNTRTLVDWYCVFFLKLLLAI
jgi:hypothetical protein